jgi:hypothetical protein
LPYRLWRGLPILDWYLLRRQLFTHLFSMPDFIESGCDSFFQLTPFRSQLNGYAFTTNWPLFCWFYNPFRT